MASTKGHLLVGCALGLVLLCPALGLAEQLDGADSGLTPTASEVREEKARNKKSKSKKKIKWAGRLFVGDVLTRQRVSGQTYWRNNHAVNSARVRMSYRRNEAKAVIKLELEDGKPDLKDAYLRLDLAEGVELQAGRFKRQMSGISLASRWKLPSVERGVLSAVDVRGLPFAGGRGDGLLLSYELPIAMKAQLSASVIAADLDSSVAVDPRDHLAEDIYLRASIGPIDDLQVASTVAFVGHLPVASDAESFNRAAIGSFEIGYSGQYAQVWAEVFYGASMFPSLADGTVAGRLLAARTLVAPRFRPGVPRRLSPFLGASFLDPRTSAHNDAVTELQGGASLAFSKMWRLQFELSQRIAQGDASPAIEATAFRIQLGANFKE